jgi:hypothetical protein
LKNLIVWKKDPPAPSKQVEGPLMCRVCDHHALVPRPEDLGHVRGNTARFKNRFFTLWRCPKCQSIANIEPVDYKDIYRDYPMLKQRLDFFARATFKNLLHRLTQAGLKPGQSVLDIGCGVGVFVEWLKTQGFNDVTGFDPMVPRFASDPVGQQFDCVVANAVLEHMEDPRAFLKDAASRVKPGGLLYVGTADAGGRAGYEQSGQARGPASSTLSSNHRDRRNIGPFNRRAGFYPNRQTQKILLGHPTTLLQLSRSR